MFVNNAYPAGMMYPAANPMAQTAPAKPGLMERLKEGFSGMGLSMGIGATASTIKQAFKKLDQRKDNALDAGEFAVVGNAFAQGPAAFGMADKNANQKVSLGEFKNWIRASTKTEFQAVDANKDGTIDANEFGAIQMRNPGVSLQGMDTNHDGRVSFREYLRFRVGTFLH